MSEPYTLYLGDFREIISTLSLDNIIIVTDPPYGLSTGEPISLMD